MQSFRLFPALILIMACASCTDYDTQHEMAKKYFTQLNGQPVRMVIDKIGYPDHTIKKPNATLYVWAYSKVENNSSNAVGFDAISGKPVTFIPDATSSKAYRCVIRIITDNNNIIKYVQEKGAKKACYYYEEKINAPFSS